MLVIGPGWLKTGLAVVMLAVAAFSAVRLAIWRLRGRNTEPEADALHVVMGTSMAGMLDSRLSLVPAPVWAAVFTAATAWFAWYAIRSRVTPRRREWQCRHPLPHAVESAAMLFMLWPIAPSRSTSPMAMPGMNGRSTNPAVALVLALFMVGYILWTTDELATSSRIPASDAIAGSSSGSRLATCSKIVMSAAMSYMLLTMV
jgi:hypothetical protein